MSEGHSYGNGVSGFDQTFGLLMRQFVPTLIRIAKLTPGQRVLDIATGTGIAAEAALDAVGPSGHVTAADDTPLMLEEARHRLGASPNVSFAVERAGSLTFPDASFNAVLCSMALMIFPDHGHALAEFHRVLRSGGQLVVSIKHQARKISHRPCPHGSRAACTVDDGSDDASLLTQRRSPAARAFGDSEVSKCRGGYGNPVILLPLL